MFSSHKPSFVKDPEVHHIAYIRPIDIRSESEGFYTLVEAGTELGDNGVLTHRAIGVEHITQRSVSYVISLLGLTNDFQVLSMLMGNEIGIEKRRDGRDRLSSNPEINPWLKNYPGFHEISPP